MLTAILLLVPLAKLILQCVPPYPGLFVEMRDLDNFLPRLAWNCDPPDLHLLRGWDYRCEPHCLTQGLHMNNYLWTERIGSRV
jgi:hypothetical protein